MEGTFAVIAMVHPGPRSRTRDLYGPGKSRYEQQSDPHLIASWDPFEPDPARTNATLDDLAEHLNRPAECYARPLLRYVWRCTALTARHDRPITDTTWAWIAARLIPHGRLGPKAVSAQSPCGRPNVTRSEGPC